MSKSAPTRAQRCWVRLASWYGARIDTYGESVPADWADAINETSPQVLEHAMDEIRTKHPVHPPTFPEFYAILARLAREQRAGPSVQERLMEYVLKHRTLTPAQLRMPWTYHAINGHEIVAVDIPDDGESNGFRVRVADLPNEVSL